MSRWTTLHAHNKGKTHSQNMHTLLQHTQCNALEESALRGFACDREQSSDYPNHHAGSGSEPPDIPHMSTRKRMHGNELPKRVKSTRLGPGSRPKQFHPRVNPVSTPRRSYCDVSTSWIQTQPTHQKEPSNPRIQRTGERGRRPKKARGTTVDSHYP